VDFQARLANPDGALRPGMFSRVLIQLPQEEPVLVVPQTAISYATYGNSVYVINPAEDNPEQLVVTRRIVKLGRTRGDFVAVLEGLEAGEQVATSGLLKLNNGTPVKINNSNALPVSTSPTPDNS
jgi:membrane fusion protein (multidrug efflux system)